jgi:hypothetical protein
LTPSKTRAALSRLKQSFGGQVSDLGNLLVFDRKTGQLVEEKIPPYLYYSIQSLYQTKLGRRGIINNNN